MKNKLQKNYPWHLRFGWLLIVPALLFAVNLTAQDEEDEEMKLEELIITGSRIARIDIEGVAPVDILTRADIDRAATVTTAELLRKLPAVIGGGNISSNISNGGSGNASVGLRGLPASNTLILINGRRVVNVGFTAALGAPDIYGIPSQAIDTIEVLKDGASAIYGSDAIAGVINFKLREDFEGAGIEAYYGNTFDKDRSAVNLNAYWGATSEKGQAFITAGYRKRNGIMSRDREISHTADGSSLGGLDQRSSAPPRPRLVHPTLGNLFLKEGVTQGTSVDDYRGQTADDVFNFNEITPSELPQNAKNISFLGQYEINPGITLFSEASFSQITTYNSAAPTPLFSQFESRAIPISAFNPWNPFTPRGTDSVDPIPGLGNILYDKSLVVRDTDGNVISDGNPVELKSNGEDGVPEGTLVGVRKRNLEIGPRTFLQTGNIFRFVGGARGTIFDKYNWEVSYLYNKDERSELSGGILNFDRTIASLGDPDEFPGAVALNLFGAPTEKVGEPNTITQDMIDYIATTNSRFSVATLASASFHITGPILDLPAGTLGFATGFDYREETISDAPDALTASGNTIGSVNFEATKGRREVSEGFFEVNVPLLTDVPGAQTLMLSAAVRFSDYSDFGTTTNPKVGLIWKPVGSLLLRATYSEGFSAPALEDLFSGQSESFDTFVDPLAPPGSDQIQFLVVSGGNPDLFAETAKSYTAGAVYSPSFAKGLTFTFDYYRIEQLNVSGNLSAQFIVNQNAFNGLFASQVHRNPDGSLRQVDNVVLNIGARNIQGYDATFSYDFPKSDWGRIKLIGSGSYISQFDDQINSDEPFIGLAGTYVPQDNTSLNGSLPRFKGYFSVDWNREHYGASFTLNYISSLHDDPGATEAGAPGDFNPGGMRDVSEWVTLDFQARYNIKKLGMDVAIGIDNFTDEPAPYTAGAFNDRYDGFLHNNVGAFYYMRLRRQF